MNKAFIFAAGFVLGGIVGTTLTVFAYQKEKKQKEEDKKLLDGKDGVVVHFSDGSRQIVTEEVKNAITTSPEELKEYYIQQLRDLGLEIYETEVDEDYDYNSKSSVNPIDDDDGEEEEEEESDIYPVEPNPEPYEIVNREFGTLDFYDSENLIWYRGDGVMCTANDLEMLDDWQRHIGDVEGRLNGCRGEELYFRNEVEQTDYEVTINKDSYKHAVEGEEDE